jgi:hypothetical protein
VSWQSSTGQQPALGTTMRPSTLLFRTPSQWCGVLAFQCSNEVGAADDWPSFSHGSNLWNTPQRHMSLPSHLSFRKRTCAAHFTARMEPGSPAAHPQGLLLLVKEACTLMESACMPALAARYATSILALGPTPRHQALHLQPQPRCVRVVLCGRAAQGPSLHYVLLNWLSGPSWALQH